MRMTTEKIIRIFSLLFVVSVVSFTRISCSRIDIKRCLENQLGNILKIVTAPRAKISRLHLINGLEENEEVNDILRLILSCVTARYIHNPRVLISPKINHPNRRFFFWPWPSSSPWNSPWRQIWSQRPSYGIGGTGTGMDWNRYDKYPPVGSWDTDGTGIYENQNYDNTYPNGVTDRPGAFDYELHNNKERLSKYDYFPGADQYDYMKDDQTKDNWHWRPVVNSNNMQPNFEHRNDELYNRDKNSYAGNIEREYLDFYNPDENSYDEQFDLDDQEFLSDGRHDDKEHNFWWDKDEQRLPIRAGQGYLRKSQETNVNINSNVAMDPRYHHE